MKIRAGISLDFLKHWHSRQLPELPRLGRLSVNHPHRNDPSAFLPSFDFLSLSLDGTHKSIERLGLSCEDWQAS
jgi:hypothetical protein